MDKDMTSQEYIKRPTNYTPELAEEICKAIAISTTEELKQLCNKNKHWPCKATIRAWRREYPEFQDMYLQAKQARFQNLVAKALKMGFDADDAYYTNKQGKKVFNYLFAERVKLMVDARQWLASRRGAEELKREFPEEFK